MAKKDPIKCWQRTGGKGGTYLTCAESAKPGAKQLRGGKKPEPAKKKREKKILIGEDGLPIAKPTEGKRAPRGGLLIQDKSSVAESMGSTRPNRVSQATKLTGLSADQMNALDPAELFGMLPTALGKMVLTPKVTGVKVARPPEDEYLETYDGALVTKYGTNKVSDLSTKEAMDYQRHPAVRAHWTKLAEGDGDKNYTAEYYQDLLKPRVDVLEVKKVMARHATQIMKKQKAEMKAAKTPSEKAAVEKRYTELEAAQGKEYENLSSEDTKHLSWAHREGGHGRLLSAMQRADNAAKYRPPPDDAAESFDFIVERAQKYGAESYLFKTLGIGRFANVRAGDLVKLQGYGGQWKILGLLEGRGGDLAVRPVTLERVRDGKRIDAKFDQIIL